MFDIRGLRQLLTVSSVWVLICAMTACKIHIQSQLFDWFILAGCQPVTKIEAAQLCLEIQ